MVPEDFKALRDFTPIVSSLSCYENIYARAGAAVVNPLGTRTLAERFYIGRLLSNTHYLPPGFNFARVLVLGYKFTGKQMKDQMDCCKSR